MMKRIASPLTSQLGWCAAVLTAVVTSSPAQAVAPDPARPTAPVIVK
ncbi:MAG: hypothetical protein NT154_41630 [Verrucomicrobia bacterium]|nr:hypothetical protein [Verrucomicrobiota bacterium]